MTKTEILRPYVEKVVKEYLGLEELVVWEDGTIPIRTGSARTLVRLVPVGDRALLQVYAPMLAGVAKTPELLDRLNELNANLFLVRMFWVADQVIASTELPAESLDKDEVATAVDAVGRIADGYDSELMTAFGGEIAFPDTSASTGAGSLPPPPPPKQAEGTAVPGAIAAEGADAPRDDPGYL